MNSNRIYNNTPIRKRTDTNFRGNLLSEKSNNGTLLIHETCFFREAKTLEFVKEYIKENYPTGKKINILDGGCSTGEETWSLAMLLKEFQPKITGFDPGSMAIELAKKGKYIISVYRKYAHQGADVDELTGDMADSYLVFQTKHPLNHSQQNYKNLFSDFFEEIEENTPKTDISNISANFLQKLIIRILPPSCKRKVFQICPQKTNLCKFVIGDIKKLDKLAKDSEVDILFFRNAMYHLLTFATDKTLEERIPRDKEETTNLLNQLFQSINKKLAPKGLFVMGENEQYQISNNYLVPKILKEQGFKPLFYANCHEASVWQKPE